MRARAWLALISLALVLVPVLAAPAGVESGEQVVLDLLAARDLDAARAALLGLRPGALDSTRARHVDLLDLAVSMAASETAADPAAARGVILARLERMRSRVEARDLPLLAAMARALGPTGEVLLTSLRRAARAGVGPRQPRSLLLDLSRDADPLLRRLAVSALAGQLAPFRARVLAGEDLGPSEQRALANPELIRALIERLGDRPPGAATDALPADLAATTPGAATALHALVLVEAPALPALRADATRPGVREAIAAIESAISTRLRRHPHSTWCSAKGEMPKDSANARRACPGCRAQLPASARHCPNCGQRVRESCPSCLALLDPGATWCPTCGAAANPDGRRHACPACRAAIRTTGRFCPECGAELRADREE